MKNNKNTWLITLRTNISVDGIIQVDEGKEFNGVWLFTEFEKAKENMKKLICAFANTPNQIFNGKGLCTAFEEYMEERKDWDQYTEHEDSDLDKEFDNMWFKNHGGYDDTAECFWKAAKLPEILKLYLTDMDNFSAETIPEGTWTDNLIGCKFSSDEIFIEGIDDGPCNGIDPYFLINTFNMYSPEKEYNFRIRSCFDDNWDYIYIDMMYSELDEEISLPLK